MKRSAIAIILIVAVLILSTAGLLVLKKYKDIFDEKFDEISLLNEKGDNIATAKAARELTDFWLEKHVILCRVVRHTQLDQITIAIARLEPLALNGEKGEFAAEVLRCKILLDDIWDSELPVLRNIF